MNLLIRADATTQIGSGHVMRCLALAQAWQELGGSVQFVAANMPPGLLSRLAAEGIEVIYLDGMADFQEDAKQTIALAREAHTDWIVIDGYQFDECYQQAIKAASFNLLFVDDYGHTKYYEADLLLNQNIYANERLYPHRHASTELLLGTTYALLRREFWGWRDWQRRISPTAGKILVTLGGGDPDNQTLKVIRALQGLAIEELEICVVVGSGNPHLSLLEAVISKSSTKITVVQQVTNMPDLMAWADVAISAGGSTCWELAFMGLPNMIIVLADNQRGIAWGLAEAGVALNLGWFEQVTKADIAEQLTWLIHNHSQRLQMSRLGQMLVDGRGSERVISRMMEVTPSKL